MNSEREPGNWITHHGNYEAHRFSGLSEINKDNVKDLKVAFTYAMGSAQGGGTDPVVFPFAGLEGTTIAEDGFLYTTTGWGVVTKLDVRGGKPVAVWKSDPQADKDWAPSVLCCGINNRGVALRQQGDRSGHRRPHPRLEQDRRQSALGDPGWRSGDRGDDSLVHRWWSKTW